MLKQTNIKFKRRLTVAGLAAVAIAAFVPFASSSAWGPERTTFTNENPADYVTFNSITNHVTLGDERNFVRVREAGTSDKFADSVKVVPGKEYEVYIYFHNNAKSKLNTEEYDYSGIAHKVAISTGLSTWTINKSTKSKVSGVVKAENSKPTEVWDEAYLETDSEKDIVLKYVTASATMHNGYKANGSVLSDEYLFSTTGTYIGENSLNGEIPGCAEYSGYITYRLRADQASSKVSKTVSKDGKNFVKSLSANPGDILTYKVEFENTGTLDLTNVTFRDKLPRGVYLVSGTTKLINTNHPDGKIMSDVIGKNGFNVGLYGKGAKATVIYQVKVADDIVSGYKCNQRGSFKNQIIVDYNVGSSNDTGESYDSSTVSVTRTCEEEPCPPENPECTEEVKECDPEKEDCGDTDECDPNDIECLCEKEPDNAKCKDTPSDPPLPKTGPGEIALAIVAVVCITTGAVYWYRSQKDLAKVQDAANKTKK